MLTRRSRIKDFVWQGYQKTEKKALFSLWCIKKMKK